MSSQWLEVAVEELDPPMPDYFDHIIFRQCYWCASEAHYAVIRTSAVSGRIYSDRACSKCAEGWRQTRISTEEEDRS